MLSAVTAVAVTAWRGVARGGMAAVAVMMGEVVTALRDTVCGGMAMVVITTGEAVTAGRGTACSGMATVVAMPAEDVTAWRGTACGGMAAEGEQSRFEPTAGAKVGALADSLERAAGVGGWKGGWVG